MACHGLLCSILYWLCNPGNICPEERWCCVFCIVLGGGRKLQFVPSGYVSRPLLLIQLVDSIADLLCVTGAGLQMHSPLPPNVALARRLSSPYRIAYLCKLHFQLIQHSKSDLTIVAPHRKYTSIQMINSAKDMPYQQRKFFLRVYSVPQYPYT